jgi:hypothetical protein
MNRTANRLLESIPDPDMPDVGSGARVPAFQPGLPEVAERLTDMAVDPQGDWIPPEVDGVEYYTTLEGVEEIEGLNITYGACRLHAIIYEGRGYYAASPGSCAEWEWSPMRELEPVVTTAYQPIDI